MPEWSEKFWLADPSAGPLEWTEKLLATPSIMASLIEWMIKLMGEVVSWPSPRSADWNELMKCLLAKYHGQPFELNIEAIEELLADQGQGPVQFSVNDVVVSCAKHHDQSISVKMLSCWLPKSVPAWMNVIGSVSCAKHQGQPIWIKLLKGMWNESMGQ